MDSISIESELTDLSNISQDHDDKIDRIMYVTNQYCGRMEAMIAYLAKKYENFESDLELIIREMDEERMREYAQWRIKCNSEGMQAANNEGVQEDDDDKTNH